MIRFMAGRMATPALPATHLQGRRAARRRGSRCPPVAGALLLGVLLHPPEAAPVIRIDQSLQLFPEQPIDRQLGVKGARAVPLRRKQHLLAKVVLDRLSGRSEEHTSELQSR